MQGKESVVPPAGTLGNTYVEDRMSIKLHTEEGTPRYRGEKRHWGGSQTPRQEKNIPVRARRYHGRSQKLQIIRPEQGCGNKEIAARTGAFHFLR